VESDPIGLAGGWNPYLYAEGNPLRFVDSMGLFSINISYYQGVGGSVNIAYSEGTWEISGKFGLGFGGGVTYSPFGTVSPHAKTTEPGYIYRTAIDAGVSTPFGGTSWRAATPNLFDYDPNGYYTELSPPEFGLEAPRGLSVSFSYGWEFGSYFQRALGLFDPTYSASCPVPAR